MLIINLGGHPEDSQDFLREEAIAVVAIKVMNVSKPIHRPPPSLKI